MDFCIISPTTGLEQYASLSKSHLVLAQVQNPTYREFYQRKRSLGDHIILDNGAYEGEINYAAFKEAIDFYRPDVVVLPDHLHKPWKETFDASMKFLDLFYDEYPHIEWMYVPQTEGHDMIGWIEGVMQAINEMDPYTIEWLGLPRVMCTHYFPQQGPEVRAKACEFLKHYAFEMKIHALGMAAGNVDELRWLSDAGCHSIDSSSPVWRAWTLGLSLTNPDHQSVWRECGTKCDFDAPIPQTKYWQQRHELILKNLEACGVNVSSRR